MPAVPRWSSPIQFELTNPYSSARGETLLFNDTEAVGQYLVQQTGCQFTIGVRSTTDNVPQADGSIPHHRFLTGTQIEMAVSLFVDDENPACDAILADLLDTLSGALRSLLNAGDNAGRLQWEIDGGNERMLDDCRLLVYPKFGFDGAFPTVTFTLDSQYPYAQDLNQTSTVIADGDTEILDNTGTADYQPVFKVFGPATSFELTNITTGLQFVYDSTLPGAIAIGGSGDYAEIDVFRNRIFYNGSGANLAAGIDQLSSDYWALVVGENEVAVDIVGGGTSATVLWAPAWG